MLNFITYLFLYIFKIYVYKEYMFIKVCFFSLVNKIDFKF